MTLYQSLRLLFLEFAKTRRAARVLNGFPLAELSGSFSGALAYLEKQ
jgi:hypothetical protein